MNQSFYADNLYRCYPFCEDSPLPKNLLAGLKIHCDYTAPSSDDDSAVRFRTFPRAYLTEFSIEDGSAELTFQIKDTSTEADITLIIPAGTEFLQTVTASDSGITITAVAGKIHDIPNQSQTDLLLRAEPVLVVWAQHRGIKKIRIVNKDRNRLPSDHMCEDKDWPEYIKKAEWWFQPVEGVGAIQGGMPFLVSDGFNCSPHIAGQTLFLSPAAGAGLGAVTEDYPLGSIDGTPEYGSSEAAYLAIYERYDGLPKDGLIYSFCNAADSEVKIESTSSIIIQPVQEEHTIYISVASAGKAACGGNG